MSQNIFDATLDPNNDVKVNNFDWSHANNLTTQIGRITPIFCDMVPAKTSFRVNPRFGLQFMPMVFPIQTRMKARIMWFRYPVRALWKDYKDFVGNFREGLEEPYINFNTEERLKKMASTGSLGDYLGLPTTLVGRYGSETVRTFESYLTGSDSFSPYHTDNVKMMYSDSAEDVVNASTAGEDTFGMYVTGGSSVGSYWSAIVVERINDSFINDTEIRVVIDSNAPQSFSDKAFLMFFDSNDVLISALTASSYSPSIGTLSFRLTSELAGQQVGKMVLFIRQYSGATTLEPYMLRDGSINFPKPSAIVSLNQTQLADVTLNTSPWYNSNSASKDKQQKILAYGFRAYEGIYNSFIRDNRNNPYYLNGRVQYNKWIPNDAGGVDNELYELRYANWEKDFLTTAVQSPQQGNAPLVGITTYTQTVANDDGTTTELIKTSLVDEDGKKYGISFKSSDEGLEGVEYVELDNGTQVRQARSLYDLATSGISIPDLRMVNCYQKFLELNMRKGYSYKDIVEGRFDVKVRYADLLMPEFFGGVSRDIDVNSVTQTVDQNAATGSGDYATALGSQSGLAGVRGEANANIECFCDEESIIMGLLIVTPLPVYTQLLPKHFTYRGLMEHYQPEFNLIGFQPIKYNEVCPIQAYNDNPDSLTETFGYNRPWYEFAQKCDVAHGLFRTDLSNFLMHRVFNQKPELAQSFLLVDPEQVTDVFAVTETTDKIYGQIWLDITCKLPIARVAIPRLD